MLKNLFGDLSLEATQVAIRNLLNTLLGKVTKVDTDNVHISNFPETQNVSGSVSVPGVATETTQQAINSKTPALGQSNKAGSVPVTIASDQGNINVSLDTASLAALETIQVGNQISGYATETTQQSINSKTPSLGQSNKAGSVPVTIASDQGNVNVSVSNPFATESTLSSINGKLPTIGQKTSSNSVSVVVSSDQPTIPVSVSGVATESTLASINGKLPTIGQKTKNTSSSVVLASDQDPLHVIVDSGVTSGLTDSQLRASAIPVVGTVELGPTSLGQLESINANVSGTVALDTGTLSALTSHSSSGLTNTELRAVPVPVSGTVALDAASLAALENVSATVSGTVSVAGSVEVTNDSGNPLPVSVSGTPTVSLDTASLAALETIQIGNQISGYATESTLASINSKTPSLGQSNKAGSVPVTIASDQGNVNVAVSSIIPITLDETSLSALEDINASISGNVGISSISESATVGTWVEDLYVRALLRKLMQLRYNSSSDLSVTVASGTVTTLTTMTTGNIGFGDAGKAASYQQVSAITGNMNRRCFQWE